MPKPMSRNSAVVRLSKFSDTRFYEANGRCGLYVVILESSNSGGEENNCLGGATFHILTYATLAILS
jgi:hypothetical protein